MIIVFHSVILRASSGVLLDYGPKVQEHRHMVQFRSASQNRFFVGAELCANKSRDESDKTIIFDRSSNIMSDSRNPTVISEADDNHDHGTPSYSSTPQLPSQTEKCVPPPPKLTTRILGEIDTKMRATS